MFFEDADGQDTGLSGAVEGFRPVAGGEFVPASVELLRMGRGLRG